jgi:hypothetical protein
VVRHVPGYTPARPERLKAPRSVDEAADEPAERADQSANSLDPAIVQGVGFPWGLAIANAAPPRACASKEERYMTRDAVTVALVVAISAGF